MSVSVWGLRGSESQQTDRDIHVNVSQAENEQLLRSMSVSSLPACTVVELCHYVLHRSWRSCVIVNCSVSIFARDSWVNIIRSWSQHVGLDGRSADGLG